MITYNSSPVFLKICYYYYSQTLFKYVHQHSNHQCITSMWVELQLCSLFLYIFTTPIDYWVMLIDSIQFYKRNMIFVKYAITQSLRRRYILYLLPVCKLVCMYNFTEKKHVTPCIYVCIVSRYRTFLSTQGNHGPCKNFFHIFFLRFYQNHQYQPFHGMTYIDQFSLSYEGCTQYFHKNQEQYLVTKAFSN